MVANHTIMVEEKWVKLADLRAVEEFTLIFGTLIKPPEYLDWKDTRLHKRVMQKINKGESYEDIVSYFNNLKSDMLLGDTGETLVRCYMHFRDK